MAFGRRAELSAIMESLPDIMGLASEAATRRAQLTATASAAGGLVRVTVNAEGTVIGTEFSDGIDAVPYANIARAVTQAAQSAAMDAEKRAAELMKPLNEAKAKLPQLEDLLGGLPRLRDLIPPEPVVSTLPPSLRPVNQQEEQAAPNPGESSGGITDRGW